MYTRPAHDKNNFLHYHSLPFSYVFYSFPKLSHSLSAVMCLASNTPCCVVSLDLRKCNVPSTRSLYAPSLLSPHYSGYADSLSASAFVWNPWKQSSKWMDRCSYSGSWNRETACRPCKRTSYRRVSALSGSTEGCCLGQSKEWRLGEQWQPDVLLYLSGLSWNLWPVCGWHWRSRMLWHRKGRGREWIPCWRERLPRLPWTGACLSSACQSTW